MTPTNATTDDLAALERRLEQLISDSASETRRHFEVIAEQLLHDFSGALKDKVSQHEDRILILERHIGLKA